MRLELLDGFELRMGQDVVPVALSAQRLIAFLALHRTPLQRLYVSSNLWIDSSEQHANASLRTVLWRLRRPGWRLIEASTHRRIALARSVAVDIHELDARSRRALAHEAGEDDLAALSGAGDLLPDWYDDWVLFERERFRQRRLHALESLCLASAEAGRFAQATEAGLAAVAGEPLRESAHRVLICAYLAEGNDVDALRQFRFYRGLIKERLGLEPSGQIMELVNTSRIGEALLVG